MLSLKLSPFRKSILGKSAAMTVATIGAVVGLASVAGAQGATTVDEATTVENVITSVDYSQADADVLRLYQAFFNRAPDDAGSIYWLAQRRDGASVEDLTWGFANSIEFITEYGQLSDQVFLTVVYNNMLGRIADQDGFDYWLGELSSGRLDQPGVVRWVTENAEFELRYPFLPESDLETRALDFFQFSQLACIDHADRTGNPAPEVERFNGATITDVRNWPLAEVTDGLDDTLLIDFSGPRVVIYSTEGPDDVLPRAYSFGCPEDLYLGTLDS